MLLPALLLHVITVRALSETPSSPQNISVDKWLVTWTPASEDDVSYTVQYLRFEGERWTSVPGCVKIAVSSCNVTSARAEDEQGCLRLRVRAERRGAKSAAVEACSRNGDNCSPEVNLIAQPGSLTVMLSRDHSLAKENGDHVTHRVYYGKEGEPLTNYKDDLASVSIGGLEEGQRYCMKVQYVLYDDHVGPPSCIKCELIPKTVQPAGQTEIIVSVVAVVVLLALSLVVTYVLINHYEEIKKCLRPFPDQFPEHLIDPFPEHHPCHVSPSEERFDTIWVDEARE